MPEPAKRPPAALDAQAHETIDLLATLVASLSNRVDKQSETLERVHMTATETRQAAFHAKAQTDPKLFQTAVNAATEDTLQRLNATVSALVTEQQEARQASQAVQKEMAVLKAALHATLKVDVERLIRRKRELPFRVTGIILLVLALAMLLPRLAAVHPEACVAVGGEPQDFTEYGGKYGACIYRFR